MTKLALSLGRSEFPLLFMYFRLRIASHSPPEDRDKRLSPRSPPNDVLRRSRQ